MRKQTRLAPALDQDSNRTFCYQSLSEYQLIPKIKTKRIFMLFYMTSYILKELTDKTKDYFCVSNLSLSQRNFFWLPQEDTKTVLFSLVLAAFTISP